MASSSSPSHQPLRYQVFLSFRGEDTSRKFTSHLHYALKSKGVAVFCDEEKLEKGEELSPAPVLNAIAESKVSIVILSEDYASSRFCLEELSKIMECKVTKGQLVLPIYYHVNRTYVRLIMGSFKESFEMQQKREPDEVKRWKDVFSKVGKIKGWCIKNRSEHEYIESIVKYVQGLDFKSTKYSEDLVGIDAQIKKILSLIGQEHTRMIGIWGMGGIGKTTLAEVVYKEVVSYSNDFDAHYFLGNVGEKSLERYGIQSLQNSLLSHLLKEDIHMDTQFIESTLIKDRLRNMRAFVVLDDVTNLDQIKHLGQYFGPGSKIIVTSRDLQVLKNIGVHQLVEVKELSVDDSLELFYKCAFKQNNPIAGFWDLAMKVVNYAKGNPHVLKVLGSALYNKTRDEWENALNKLEESPERYAKGDPVLEGLFQESRDEWESSWDEWESGDRWGSTLKLEDPEIERQESRDEWESSWDEWESGDKWGSTVKLEDPETERQENRDKLEIISKPEVPERQEERGDECETTLEVPERQEGRGDERVITMEPEDPENPYGGLINTEDKSLRFWFLVIGLILEIASLVCDQLTSKDHPQFAFVSMLISILASAVCLIELILKGVTGRYRLKLWRRIMPMFYCSKTKKPFGYTLWDLVGFTCAVSDVCFKSINYSFISQHHQDGPIKISVLPVLLTFGLLYFVSFRKLQNPTAIGIKTVYLFVKFPLIFCGIGFFSL